MPGTPLPPGNSETSAPPPETSAPLTPPETARASEQPALPPPDTSAPLTPPKTARTQAMPGTSTQRTIATGSFYSLLGGTVEKKSTSSRRTNRRNVSNAEILTSPPYKNQLQQQKQSEENKKATKGATKRTKHEQAKAKKKGSKKPKTTDIPSQVTVCAYCTETEDDTPNDAWIRCQQWAEWVHTECAGADDDQDTFVCNFCWFATQSVKDF